MLSTRAVVAALVAVSACRPEVAREPGVAECLPPLGAASFGHLRGRGVEAAIQAPGAARAGDAVRLALVVRNDRVAPVILEQAAVTRADFVVTRAGDSVPVWRLVAGGVVGEGGFTDTLTPGAERVYPTTWDQRTVDGEAAPPGAYCVYAYLLHAPPYVASPPPPFPLVITR